MALHINDDSTYLETNSVTVNAAARPNGLRRVPAWREELAK
jgi:hypothetical protein